MWTLSYAYSQNMKADLTKFSRFWRCSLSCSWKHDSKHFSKQYTCAWDVGWKCLPHWALHIKKACFYNFHGFFEAQWIKRIKFIRLSLYYYHKHKRGQAHHCHYSPHIIFFHSFLPFAQLNCYVIWRLCIYIVLYIET